MKDAGFLLYIMEKMPAIVYVNRYEKPGKACSLRNVWSSMYAQRFIGLTQAEIDEMGFAFFEKTMHPDDLSIIKETIQLVNKNPEETVFTFIHRMKPINAKDYVWLYGHGVMLDFFDNGTPRSSLNISFEISAYMNTKNQFSEALKEIGRLQHELQCRSLTKREREVLGCISKGLTDKQISQKLFISDATAKTHRNNILRKLNIKNSASLAAFAAECGMNH